MEQGYNYKKVHKLNLFAIYGVAIVFALKTLLFDDSFEDVLYAGLVIGLSTIIYFIPMKHLVKGFFFGFVPTLVAIAVSILSGFALTNHYIIVIAIAIIALYFNSTLLLVYGSVLNIMFIITYIVTPDSLIGASGTLASFLSVIVMLNGALILLFFLNKWGKNIIDESIKSQQNVLQVMQSLKMTLSEVENGTQVLGENTAIMADNAAGTNDSSKQVAIAMQEIAIGVQEQAESVTEINMQVSAISEDVESAHKISQHLTDSNKEMMVEVTSGEEQIAHMKSQMTIIDDSIDSAIVTVKDLEESMGDIQNFLSVITNISSQTNLLALNASIESARAGEAGKGFAVVADEIRKLAEQSSASVKDINKIVESIGIKTQDAVSTVSLGNEAVVEGSKIINMLTEQYGKIKNSFVDNNDELSNEIQMINQINEAFTIVHEKISNIASISQEQSASTEEILATIENQGDNIENLTDSLEDIKALSTSLSNLVADNRIEE